MATADDFTYITSLSRFMALTLKLGGLDIADGRSSLKRAALRKSTFQQGKALERTRGSQGFISEKLIQKSSGPPSLSILIVH